MFSQTVEYALRAAVHLAAQHPSPCTTDEVAQATCVPKAYLAKVLQSLNRAGLVHSQRGIHGGVCLARDPNKMTILEVVNAMEPIVRIRMCPLNLASHGVNLCPLHRRLDDALGMVEKAFGETTLAELFSDSSPIRPLCEVTPVKKGKKKVKSKK